MAIGTGPGRAAEAMTAAIELFEAEERLSRLAAPPLVAAARELAHRGFAFVPVEPWGKRPLITGWHGQATTDLCQIDGWAVRWPTANAGVVLGDDVVVVDFDDVLERRGPGVMAALECELGPLPSTWAATTGTGLHLYYRAPARIPSDKSVLGHRVEVYARGRLVVVAPSRHAVGVPYTWLPRLEPDSVELAMLPGGWVQHLLDHQRLAGGARAVCR